MLVGLRGLAQSFVRGAVAIGRGIESTYTALSELGLGYVREQFNIDWQAYDQQKAFIDLANELDPEQLIPGAIHGDSPLNLTTRFKYDVKAVYEDPIGNTVEKHWSVISDQRMTQDEIMDYAGQFAQDYAPEEFPFHAAPELTGIWAKA